MTNPEDHALSFGAEADAYDRARPSYPDEVVDWFLHGIRGRVVDVGAGTGKLTSSLAARRDDVIAVEPDSAMRDVLAARLPGIEASPGSAEELPLDDGTAGLVTLAQAWHWVDVPRSCAEVARVLARPGRLGLVWNYRWEGDEWVRCLSEALGGIDSAGHMHDIQENGPRLVPPFGAAERLVVRWDHVLDVATLVALATSRSYVITRPEHEREQVLAAVRALGEERADADGSVRMPYETYAFRVDLS